MVKFQNKDYLRYEITYWFLLLVR